ncbi:MAG: ABA4-like family protein [Bacteroidota bacterium]
MSDEQLFLLANGTAFFAWLLLLIFPFRPFTNKVLIGVVVTILCITYAVLVYNSLKPGNFKDFMTLGGVTAMLSVPGAALAGWIHYLAFDLMTGLFIANNAAKHGIGYAWLLPCLILTFLLGPIGLLLYFLIRWALTKYYFADNY